MSNHNRRGGYWRQYHLAHTLELDALVDGIVSLVKESGLPDEYKRSRRGRGRRLIHSREKLVVLCVLTVILGCTFREMQRLVPRLGLPWKEEPSPDHSTIHRTYQRLPEEYLDSLLERSARLCIREAGWKKGVLAADSSGVETDRYEEVSRPSRSQRRFVTIRRILWLKYHIVAVLDHLVILRAMVTGYRVHDSPMLRRMLAGFPRMPGCVFNADRGYDAEKNCERLYALGMRPNIRQKDKMSQWGGVKAHKKLFIRIRAAKSFDRTLYRYRGLIEGIFGAEEIGGHRLRCRFRTEGSRERWGPALAIGWNLKVLNRIRCGKRLGMEVMPIIRN
jgi:hypothetical protein